MARVLVAHVLPVSSDDEKQVVVEEARLDVFREFYRELFNGVRREAHGFYEENVEGRGGGALARWVGLLSDLIVMYTRLSLTATVTIPGSRGYVGYSPHELFWVWRLSNDLVSLGYGGDELRRVFAEFFSTELTEVDQKRVSEYFKKSMPSFLGLVFKLSTSPGAFHKALDAFARVPADTRPGLNSAKLIAHMLSVSAIAYVKSESRGLSMLDREVLRLSSLLHDIGKPGAWEAGVPHTEAGGEEAERFLRCLLPDELVDAVKELVKWHHDPSRLAEEARLPGGLVVKLRRVGSLVREADRDASSLDRLVEAVAPAVAKALGDDVGKVRRYLTGSGRDAWEYWASVGEERLRRASEEAVKAIVGPGPAPAEPPAIEGCNVLAADVRGIQSFIRREKIPAMIGGSVLVDYVSSYLLPRVVCEELGVAPECVITSGGGEAKAVCSEKVVEAELEARLRSRLDELTGRVGPGVSVAVVKMYKDWAYTNRLLAARLAAKKLVYRPGPRVVRTGYEVYCEFCGERPVNPNGDGVRVCNQCSKLEKFGREYYVGWKLNVLGEEEGLEELPERLMEWLSGARDWRRESLGLAVVKLDGNNMGVLVSSMPTLSSAYEASIRIDSGLKKGLTELFKRLAEACLRDVLSRVYVGLLYWGGDDMLALWPAWVSIPASLTISYWFWRSLGLTTQLSVGIVVGKPKHNLWSLLDSSAKMLSVCKKRSRDEVRGRTSVASGGGSPFYIALAYSEQMLHPSLLDDLLRDYEEFSRQPYSSLDETAELLTLSGLIEPGSTSGTVKELIERVWGGLARKGFVDDVRRSLDVAREALTLMSKRNKYERNKYEFVAYAARQSARLDRDEPRRASCYREAAKASLRGSYPAFDVVQVCKMLGEKP